MNVLREPSGVGLPDLRESAFGHLLGVGRAEGGESSEFFKILVISKLSAVS